MKSNFFNKKKTKGIGYPPKANYILPDSFDEFDNCRRDFYSVLNDDAADNNNMMTIDTNISRTTSESNLSPNDSIKTVPLKSQIIVGIIYFIK